jgi:hypothetical protein
MYDSEQFLGDDCHNALVAHLPLTIRHNDDGPNQDRADAFSAATYGRYGDEMLNSGLYVELGPSNFNFFQFGRLPSPRKSNSKHQPATTVAV